MISASYFCIYDIIIQNLENVSQEPPPCFGQILVRRGGVPDCISPDLVSEYVFLLNFDYSVF